MNYDKIAAMKVRELRPIILNCLAEYDRLTGDKITKKEVMIMPKSRLLYMLCRFWAEIDAQTKYKRMAEELQHRAATLAETQCGRVGEKRQFLVTVEEVRKHEDNKSQS